MHPSVASLLDTLKSMLLQDPEELMDDYEDFASVVADLRNYTWCLNHPQREFLNCLLELRNQMISDFPFIASVEESRRHSQRSHAALFDEMWLVKEGMRMYKGTLVASFDEEESLDQQLDKMRMEIDQLMEKRKRLKEDIREDIAKLLEKRRVLQELQDRQKAQGEVAAQVHVDLDRAREFKGRIDTLWDLARDAASSL
jgi:uncharacterized coiled-coil DUF342 family protein